MSAIATEHWQGTVVPGFEPVAEEVDRNIAELGETGLAVAAYVEGKPVVDIWSGSAGDRPWEADTLTWVFSCTKGALAMCLAILYDRGLLDLDAPVTKYWPEFGAAGKSGVLVKELLSHQAAVFTFDDYIAKLGPDWRGVADWELCTRELAAAPQTAPTGTMPYYHGVSIGFLGGELVRRIDGRMPGRFFAEEVAGPLGLDFWIGLPDELAGRVATLQMGAPKDLELLTEPERQMGELIRQVFDAARARVAAGDVLSPEAIPWSASWLPPDVDDSFWSERAKSSWFRGCELPAGNGLGTARALARMYSLLAEGGELDGVRLVSPATIDRVTRTESVVPGIGEVGLVFHRPGPTHLGPISIPTAFGHMGAGGNLAWADPAKRLGFAYVKSAFMQTSKSGQRVVEALYRCLG